MPEAPSLYAIYDFETQLETAFAEYLQADHGMAAYHSQGEENLPDDFAFFQIQVQQATGPEVPPTISHTGFREQNTFEGVLVLEIQTERSKSRLSPLAGITSYHRGQVARARVAMLRGKIANGSFELPYLSLVHIGSAGAVYNIDEDKGSDITQLSFAVRFVIADDAWPEPVDA